MTKIQPKMAFYKIVRFVTYELRWNLKTLSACDTGIGRLQGQEGISSMVGSFLLAGARSVVASLWQVDYNRRAF